MSNLALTLSLVTDAGRVGSWAVCEADDVWTTAREGGHTAPLLIPLHTVDEVNSNIASEHEEGDDFEYANLHTSFSEASIAGASQLLAYADDDLPGDDLVMIQELELPAGSTATDHKIPSIPAEMGGTAGEQVIRYTHLVLIARGALETKVYDTTVTIGYWDSVSSTWDNGAKVAITVRLKGGAPGAAFAARIAGGGVKLVRGTSTLLIDNISGDWSKAIPKAWKVYPSQAERLSTGYELSGTIPSGLSLTQKWATSGRLRMEQAVANDELSLYAVLFTAKAFRIFCALQKPIGRTGQGKGHVVNGHQATRIRNRVRRLRGGGGGR